MLFSQSKKKSSKMVKKRQRGEVMEAPEIPFDMQIEILNRLPIKSLARFKCVSKLWSSFISSKGYFFASPPRLYITLLENISYKKSALLSLTSSTSKSSTVFDLDITKQGMGGFDMVVLRGLILYTVDAQACIYNPTTGQRVTLPAIKFTILTGKKVIYDYFLGYDPVLDQYKVVFNIVAWSSQLPRRIDEQHWWVFVLEEGSSWKKIKCDQPHISTRDQPHISTRGLCIKGVIYYLTSSSVFGRIIIGFDVRFEEFNMIHVPSKVHEHLYIWYLELIEYGGKPTILDSIGLQDPSGLLNLWVLEDGGIWSNKSVVLQPCQMHFFPSSIDFQVIGTTQNGEVIFKPEEMDSPYYILYYDLDKNDVKRVDIRGISKEPFLLALMDTGESIMHLKT